MKTVLVICYYWPPAGGSGVQRVAKLCKYLPEHGWRPVVVTVADGNYPEFDPSLEPDVAAVEAVYRAPSWEPHRLLHLRGKSSAKAGGGPGNLTLRRVADWVRLNLFVPDARIGWLAPGIAAARRALAEQRPAAIFSSAPPYTAHLIARRIARESGLPWIADFRDPWLENHAYNTSPRLGIVKRINRRLEGSVLREASCVVCVGEEMRDLLVAKPELIGFPDRCVTIPNGYDESDLQRLGEPRQTGRFCLSHFGRLYMRRFPESAVEAAADLVREESGFRSDFRLRVAGGVDADVAQRLRGLLPEDTLDLSDYVPHERVLETLAEPQVLLLSIDRVPHNELIITGKVFEYVTSGNPVLGVGPQPSDPADILSGTGAGRMYDYGDREGMRAFLLDAYRRWQSGSLCIGPRRIERYERRNLAGSLAALLDTLTR